MGTNIRYNECGRSRNTGFKRREGNNSTEKTCYVAEEDI